MENMENGLVWHQTKMQLMVKWAAYIAISLALIGIGAAVAIRAVGAALAIVSTYRIDVHTINTMAVFIGLVMLAGAVSFRISRG